MSMNAKTLSHFVELMNLRSDPEEQAYCLKAARRWAAWIIAGEA